MTIAHITITARGRRRLTRDEVEMRVALRAKARACRAGLLVFSIADDHSHTVARCNEPHYLAREVRAALRRVLPEVELEPSHVKVVNDRDHLKRLVSYMIRQPAKHGLPGHPALWEGSSFGDLAGVRLLPGYDVGSLLVELPRLRLRDLLGVVGLSPEPVGLATSDDLRQAGVARIVQLALGAHALPSLAGRSAGIPDARALVVQAAIRAEFRPSAVAPFLDISPRAARRLAGRALDPRALPTLLRRLSLELRCGLPSAGLAIRP